MEHTDALNRRIDPGIQVLYSVQYPIAPGAVYTRDVIMDVRDGRQEAHILRLEKGAPLRMDACMPEGAAFGMVEPSRMAAFSVPEGATLLCAVNADFFNMTNGVPEGVVAMHGAVIKEIMPVNTRFFGVTKAGEAFIGNQADFISRKAELFAAVGGRDLLVDGDRLPTPVLEPKQNRHPRTAVGLDKAGNVYLVVVDGRNPGVSEGLYLDRFGAYLRALGIDRAMNLDGGGSSVMSLRLPGQKDISVVNAPSDGRERICANGLAVSLLMPGDGICRGAFIAPQQAYIAPCTRVRFTASGLDKSSAPCALPANARFTLAGEGEITPDGWFTAPENACDTRVLLVTDEGTLGETRVMIRVPDQLEVENEYILAEGETHMLAPKAFYHYAPVLSGGEAFRFDVPSRLGTVDAQGVLHAGAKGQTGMIAVRSRAGGASAQMNVLLERLPLALTDFDSELPAARGCALSSIAPRDYSARTGSHVLIARVQEANAALKAAFHVPRMPGAIGLWARAESGAPLALSLRVLSGDRASQSARFKPGEPSDCAWTYYEAPITGLPDAGACDITLELTFAARPQDVFALDSLRAVFGCKRDDAISPEIPRIDIKRKDDAGLTNITAYFAKGALTSFAAPIDYPALRVFLDGEEKTGLAGHYGVNKGGGALMLHNVRLAPGMHTVRVCARDLSNNQTWKEVAFDPAALPLS